MTDTSLLYLPISLPLLERSVPLRQSVEFVLMSSRTTSLSRNCIIRQIVYNPAIREMALKWWHRTPEPHPGLESLKKVIDDILVELRIRQWAKPITYRVRDELGEVSKKFPTVSSDYLSSPPSKMRLTTSSSAKK